MGLAVEQARPEAEMHLAHNIKYNNLNGVVQVLAGNMIGPFVGIFAIKLGASNAQIAMLSSLPALFSLAAMLPGAWFVDRFPRKQGVTAAFFLLTRVFYLCIAATPWFSPVTRPAYLVAAVALMSVPGAIANVAWQSFIAGIIPPARRGQAFATRNRLVSLCGVTAMLVTGRLLDRLSFPWGYQLMFSLAFLLALLEIGLFLRLREGTPSAGTGTRGMGLGALARAIGEQPAYLRFVAASLVFHFGWQMAWPLFLRFQVNVLDANNTWLSIHSALNTCAGALAYPLWARRAEARGNLPILAAASMGLALSPIWYAISTELWHIAAFSMAMGFFVSGTVLLLFNTLLEVTPVEGRTSFIAAYNTVINLSATVAPFAGIWLLELLGIREALLVSAGMRIIGSSAFFLLVRASRQAGAVKSCSTSAL